MVRTHHTYAYKPTCLPGIQHQVLRLESERKTKKTMERLRGRHPQNSRDVPSPGHPGAKPAVQHIKQQQIKWFGHITRMPINQPAFRAYNTKYSGWRARGRPRKRWSDSVADTLRAQGMSLLQATQLAAVSPNPSPATPTGTSGRKE